MKTLRKRAIYNSIKTHANTLLNLYNNNEQSLACCRISILTIEQEISICNTLSHYSHIIEKVVGDVYGDKDMWINKLYNFY